MRTPWRYRWHYRTLAEPDNMAPAVRVYVILDQRSSPEPPLGDAVETFIRREDA